jgi:NADH-quinone oxidoreductase subunit F
VIADTVLLSDQFEVMAARIVGKRLAPSGKTVAVVGGGPTGLTAAFYLALTGHAVTVFESHSEACGMLRFALPPYRLPREVLDREIEIIRRLGVRFVFDSHIGTDTPLAELEAQFDAVFLSIGTWKESQVRVAGNELSGVYGALHFLEGEARDLPAHLGENAVIIGGGNAAIDCARTVIRRGASATLIYRRERKDMPAIAEEVDAAEEEGVRFVFLASPHRILGSGGSVVAIEVTKTRLGAFDTSGRRRPVDTGEVQSFPCGSVILAVGEGVDLDFCRASGLAMKDSGTLKVDRYALTTSRANVYAGGDFVTGASNVTSAMAWGKEAARNIDRHLASEPRYDSIMPIFEYGQTPPETKETPRHNARFLPAAVRAKTFAEAVAALPPEAARAEACRCLRCDIRETAAHAVASRRE